MTSTTAGDRHGTSTDLTTELSATAASASPYSLEPEAVRDQAGRIDPPGPQGAQRPVEGELLGERALDGQLAPEDVVRGHRPLRRLGRHAVDEDRAAGADQPERLLQHRQGARWRR